MFFETIKLLNGQLHNLSYHQERMNRTRDVYFAHGKEVDLKDLIPIASEYSEGLYKVRVDYGVQITKVGIDPYSLKTHKNLKILNVGDFDYPFKFSDRNYFASKLSEWPDFDDILFTRNGFLTDTTYCNIVLYDGHEWVTPNTFLLCGTKRSQLLADKIITERNTSSVDLHTYQKICFINAMRDFEKSYTFVINQDQILLTEDEH